MLTDFQRTWLRRTWGHYRRARGGAAKYQPTAFWDCVKVTLAILLDRYVEDRDDRWDLEVCELAWGDFGTYETDYGTGTSWEALTLCRGLRYAVHGDGSL